MTQHTKENVPNELGIRNYPKTIEEDWEEVWKKLSSLPQDFMEGTRVIPVHIAIGLAKVLIEKERMLAQEEMVKKIEELRKTTYAKEIYYTVALDDVLALLN